MPSLCHLSYSLQVDCTSVRTALDHGQPGRRASGRMELSNETETVETGLLVVSIQSCCYCSLQQRQGDTADGAPPPAKVVPFADAALFTVDHPEQFPLPRPSIHCVGIGRHGNGYPDVSRNVRSFLSPRDVSWLSGRLGDTVQKGQLLMTIRSDDVSGGYSNYKWLSRMKPSRAPNWSAPRIFTSTVLSR